MFTSSEILNIRSDADAKAMGAAGFINELDGMVVDLNNLQTFLTTFPFWNYETLVKDITAYLEDLIAQKNLDPAEPDSLGVFTIPDAPSFVPTDLTLLHTALQELLQVIDTLPNKITEAIAIADALYTVVYADLTVGGYGITEGDETALVNRVRDRELRTTAEAIAEIQNKAAALGYTVPPGEMLAAVAEVIVKSKQNISEANREVYVKRAELYRDNRKFTIEQAQAISKFYVDFTAKKAELLQVVSTAQLSEAKLTVEVFLGQLQAFQAIVDKIIKEQGLLGDVYKIRTEVWKEKITAAAQVVSSVSEANKLLADVNYQVAHGKLDELILALDKEKVDFTTNVTRCTELGKAYAQAAASIAASVSGIMAAITEQTED